MLVGSFSLPCSVVQKRSRSPPPPPLAFAILDGWWQTFYLNCVKDAYCRHESNQTLWVEARCSFLNTICTRGCNWILRLLAEPAHA